MRQTTRLMCVMAGAALAAAAMMPTGSGLDAQSVTSNPFRPTYEWGELPAGRTWGSTSAVDIAADGNIWVAERCGANTCVGSTVDPILLFSKDGKLIRSFGAGLLAWPHGIDVDHEGNVWVTDAWAAKATTTGHTVLKFSPDGKLLMTIGEPGVAGDPPKHLSRPSDVLVAPNGEIYIGEAQDQSRSRRLIGQVIRRMLAVATVVRHLRHFLAGAAHDVSGVGIPGRFLSIVFFVLMAV